MNWIVTSIILGVLLLLAILYCVLFSLQAGKKQKESYDKGAGDTFNWILEAGYSQKVSEFKLLNKHAKPGQIVLVGDSLTDNYPVSECFNGFEYEVYNRGIGGDTTDGLLKRFDESIVELNPKVVVLLMGINDFALKKDATPLTVASSLQCIVNKIHAALPETKIILEAIYPVNKSSSPKIDVGSVGNKDNGLIKETNEILSKIEGVTFLDLTSVLSDERGELKLELTREGLHLNAEGYFLITPVLEEAIRKEMR